MDNDEKCQRSNCDNNALENHICPFKAEIHEDTQTLCNCCEDCINRCREEI